MPKTKNAMFRYLVLDRCLSNRGRRYTWKDLLAEVNKAIREVDPSAEGIGKTTYYEDIRAIEYEVFSAEIERYKEGRTTYLRYSDPSFSISNQPLNEVEVRQLNAALQVLARIQGNPQFEWVHEIIPMLESKLKLGKVDKPVMSFESNPDYPGLSFITPIFNAIVNRRVLKFNYKDFKSELAYDFHLHPYYLRQYNGRWYVYGYNEERGRIENPALDRVREVTEVDLEYREDNRDWQDYFSDFIGVTRYDGEPGEVRILINDALQASYIQTNPLHQTQKPIRQVAGGFETSFRVIPNVELEKLLLSFGDRIKVLAPEGLRTKLAARLRNASLQYSSGEEN